MGDWKVIVKDKKIKSILKTILKELEVGKPGISISQLSRKTGIERHQLSGIIEVLTVMGIIAIFRMGMVKMVTLSPDNLKTLSQILFINKAQKMV